MKGTGRTANQKKGEVREKLMGKKKKEGGARRWN